MVLSLHLLFFLIDRMVKLIKKKKLNGNRQDSLVTSICECP